MKQAVLGGVRGAIMVLTRIPMSPVSSAAWRWAPAWFPAVGTGLGVLIAGVWWIAGAMGPVLASLMAVGAGVMLTGALHEDGLADSADALGGGTSRDEVFRILKDSRVGTYGALALILSAAVRVVALVELGPHAPVALVVSHTLARVTPVWLLKRLPYVSPVGVAKHRAVAQPAAGALSIATMWSGVMMAGLWRHGSLSALAAALAVASTAGVTVVCGFWFRRRLGGITGDLMGAAEQAVEMTVLVVLVAILWP